LSNEKIPEKAFGMDNPDNVGITPVPAGEMDFIFRQFSGKSFQEQR
jgi:hypothetical protein